MYRTISLRLKLVFEQDNASLLRTMELYAKAYNISAEYGFEMKESNKFRNSTAVYKRIRTKMPELPSMLVQTACHMATESSVSIDFKSIPIKKEHSAIRYTTKAMKIDLENGTVSISAIGMRV